MERKKLDEESLERLRLVLKQEEWEVLMYDAVEAWKNRCSNKIVSGPDVNSETLAIYAGELKYGTSSILWFFERFVPDMVQAKIDKENK